MRESEINITPSILDRLIDLEPRESSEPPRSRLNGLRDLKAAVRRDIESLLNARFYAYDIDDGLEEVHKSLAVYGLPDFTGMGAKNPAEQAQITSAIARAIETFEPRFINVKVHLEPVSNVDKQLVFRIEASLNIEPTPEPIVFDTVLSLGSGEISVVEK